MRDKGREIILPVVAVNAIILDSKKRILLTKRSDINIWCLPGGLVEFGETIKNAIIREVKEEIGVQCKVEKLTGIYSSNNIKIVSPTKICSIILAFQCTIVRGFPRMSEEVSDVSFFTLNKLPKLIKNQRIRIKDALNFSDTSFIR